MNFVVKMIDFVVKMMDFPFKTPASSCNARMSTESSSCRTVTPIISNFKFQILNAKSIVFNAKSIIFTTKFMTFFYKIFNASSRSGVHTVFSINPHVRDIHYKSWQIMTKKRIGMIVRSIWGMFLRGFARGGFLQWYLPTKCARRRRCLTGSTSPSMAAQLYVLTFKLTILCWNWRFYTNEMMNL